MAGQDRSSDAGSTLICAAPHTTLDLQSARQIIIPYFLALQEQFQKYAHDHHGRDSGKRVRGVRLEVHPWAELHHELGFNARNYAATSEDGSVMIIAPEAVDLDEPMLMAIIAHEFGHVLDFVNPGSYGMAGSDLVRWRISDADDPRVHQSRVARIRQWEARDADQVEVVADRLATAVTGQPINYAGPCMLQTFARGRPRRPKGLR